MIKTIVIAVIISVVLSGLYTIIMCSNLSKTLSKQVNMRLLQIKSDKESK